MVDAVTAYEDVGGRLHKTERDAVVADFIIGILSVWGRLPCEGGIGDPVVIARALSSDVYTGARHALIAVLREFEDGLANVRGTTSAQRVEAE